MAVTLYPEGSGVIAARSRPVDPSVCERPPAVQAVAARAAQATSETNPLSRDSCLAPGAAVALGTVISP
jgi:hypothetical protein